MPPAEPPRETPDGPTLNSSMCCGSAVDVSASWCGTNQCTVTFRMEMAHYTPGPWYHISLWTNLFGTVVPVEVGGGIYQASFDVDREETLLYTFDVNDLRQLNDHCSEVDDVFNTSKIYVDCNVSQCSSPRGDCSNAWCEPASDLGRAAAASGSASSVRLFEWPYVAIGDECKRLGKQGWTAVEISPPAYHQVLNDSQRIFPPGSWPERELPVDLTNLNSASGAA